MEKCRKKGTCYQVRSTCSGEILFSHHFWWDQVYRSNPMIGPNIPWENLRIRSAKVFRIVRYVSSYTILRLVNHFTVILNRKKSFGEIFALNFGNFKISYRHISSRPSAVLRIKCRVASFFFSSIVLKHFSSDFKLQSFLPFFCFLHLFFRWHSPIDMSRDTLNRIVKKIW